VKAETIRPPEEPRTDARSNVKFPSGAVKARQRQPHCRLGCLNSTSLTTTLSTGGRHVSARAHAPACARRPHHPARRRRPAASAPGSSWFSCGAAVSAWPQGDPRRRRCAMARAPVRHLVPSVLPQQGVRLRGESGCAAAQRRRGHGDPGGAAVVVCLTRRRTRRLLPSGGHGGVRHAVARALSGERAARRSTAWLEGAPGSKLLAATGGGSARQRGGACGVWRGGASASARKRASAAATAARRERTFCAPPAGRSLERAARGSARAGPTPARRGAKRAAVTVTWHVLSWQPGIIVR
jgi:hypothetical protein